MFPRAVMCSSTAYGAVVCIRGLTSFSDLRISPAPVLSCTHSKGIHKCFHGCCGSKVVASKSQKVCQMRMP